MERIQKILAHGGIASRRAAEQLIKAGRVRVNGHVVTELGAKADARRDKVEVDGKRVVAEDFVYIVLHKPRGVVSTMSDPEGRPTVKELLSSVDARVYPVGRLDFATSGVLLVTNDGELADGLLHPRKTVPKSYVLKVKGVMKPDDLEVWRKGVRLEDGMTLPADAKLIRHEVDKTWLELTIREGRNQQIRRMGDATRFPVMRLARVSFAEISAEGLAPGRWRHLTRDELLSLKKTYGVPRSIPSAAATPRSLPERTQRTVPAARRGSAGRTQRAFGNEERRGDVEENWGERSTRGSTAQAEKPGGRERPTTGRGGPQRGERPTTGRAGPQRGGSTRPERAPHRGDGARAERGPQRGDDARAERGPQRGDDARTGRSGPQRGGPQRGDGSTTGPRAPQRNDSPARAGGSRYGSGGTPGRRSEDVGKDWGGGAGRGATRGEERVAERPRSDVAGGRLGRTRTTGTAGGPGTNEPAPRVKGRRAR